MPLGLLFVGWDNKVGSIIKATYPNTFSISQDLITRILMTHSYEVQKKEEFLELKLDNYFVFSYCDKSKINSIGYEMVIMILDSEEKEAINDYKEKFIEAFSGFSEINVLKKKESFVEAAKRFFTKRTARKVVFLGLPNVGKTTIKNIFFEGQDSESIIKKDNMPTVGINHYIYKWLDLELAIVDTAGQEINYFFNDDFQRDMLFSNTDAIIYVIDISRWEQDLKEELNNKKLVVKHLTSIIMNIKEKINAEIGISHSKNYSQEELELLLSKFKRISLPSLYIFCNKIDLIDDEDRDKRLSKIKNELNRIINQIINENKIYNNSIVKNVEIFFTSIDRDLIFRLYSALQLIINNLSDVITKIEDQILPIINNTLKTQLLLISYDNYILSNFSSLGFNFAKYYLLNDLLKNILGMLDKMGYTALKNLSLQIMPYSENKDDLKIYIRYLGAQKLDIKYLIYISKDNEQNTLKSLDEIYAILRRLNKHKL
ncbi:MAG: Rab family GTPase [Promethearchaeota archaeon]